MLKLPAPGLETVAELRDEPCDRPIVKSTAKFEGKIWSVRTDEIDLGEGGTVTRDVISHLGAVGILAVDDQERVLFVQQYRHPIASKLWEPPAGLLDMAGEDPLDAAKRELYEEAGHRAENWWVLVDMYNSPGGGDEAIRLYLAQGLSEVGEDERHVGEGEELDMPVAWVPLEEAVRRVMAGDLHNPAAVAGILALAASRGGWDDLRPADAPWAKRSSVQAAESARVAT